MISRTFVLASTEEGISGGFSELKVFSLFNYLAANSKPYYLLYL